MKDDWESSDEEEKPKTAAAAPPAKKKMSFKQKIAQKEEEERRRAAAGIPADDEDVDPMEYDPIARKRAERAAQLDADLGNAADLLGTASISKDDTAATSLSSQRPSSKEDWEKLAADIAATLLRPQSGRDSAGYAKHFVPALTKQLIEPIRDVDARKLSTSVKTWADDKTKAEKEAKRSGGNRIASAAAAKPKQVGTSSAKNTQDLGAYGNEALDDGGSDLDFM